MFKIHAKFARFITNLLLGRKNRKFWEDYYKPGSGR